MTIDWVEWIGYLASFLVLISLLMSSIIKLRWINLIGASIFSAYGFIIGALPVGIMNLGIALINVYYLIKIYKSYQTKEYFKILEINSNSEYFNYFKSYHRDGIDKYFPNQEFSLEDSSIGFYVLRNMVPAGVFLASKYDETTLLVKFDFVIPEYRDFKIGKYIYEEQQQYFLDKGFNRFISYSYSESHSNFLIKMGFKESMEGNKKVFIKEISSN